MAITNQWNGSTSTMPQWMQPSTAQMNPINQGFMSQPQMMQQPQTMGMSPAVNLADQNPMAQLWDQGKQFMGEYMPGMDTLFGDKSGPGIVSPMMQGLGQLATGWTAMQQLDLSKKQFAAEQDAYRTNLANQTKLTNQSLSDRQRLRQSYAGEGQDLSDQWKKENLL